MVRAPSTAVLRPKKRPQFKKILPNPRKPQLHRHYKNCGPPNNSPRPPARENSAMELPGEEEEEEENGVLQVFREEQLGRNVFLLAVPISAGFVTYYNPISMPLHARLVIVAVAVGATTIWNGILLRRAFPRAASALELFGVAFMLLAFFGYLGSRLPGSFLWLPLLCFLLSLIPIVVGAAFFFGRAKDTPENVAPAPAGLDMV